MRPIRLPLACAALLFAACVGAAPANSRDRLPARAAESVHAARIGALSWLAGAWRGVQDHGAYEEQWLAPAGGAMLGLSRFVEGGRMRSFEFLRIEEHADGLVFTASPSGQATTSFKLARIAGRRVEFENLEHDFPVRIIYFLESTDTLAARVEGRDGRHEDFRMRRVRAR